MKRFGASFAVLLVFGCLSVANGGQIYQITYADVATNAAVDLTATGTVDWVKWSNGETTSSYTSPEKTGGTNINATLTPLGTVPAGQSVVLTAFIAVAGLTPLFSWTNGTAAMAGNAPVGTSVSETIAPAQNSYPLGLGCSFQCLATTNLRQLNIYVVAFDARMKLVASLSGGGSSSLIASNAALVLFKDGSFSNVFSFGVYSVLYSGAGETLTLNLTADNQTGIPTSMTQYVFRNAGVFAATISGPKTPFPILLTSPVRLPGGSFQFDFTNSPGLGFNVFANTNVAVPGTNWTSLGLATELSPGQFRFTDPQAATLPARYYFVRWP